MADLLLVDDDTDMAELLAELLREEGHQVRVAADGAHGLECLDHHLPDVVLLDVEMPLMTGPEMVQCMCDQNRGRETIPIVLNSATVDLARIAARVGTPYMLPKPAGIENVLAIIARALAERTPPRPCLS